MMSMIPKNQQGIINQFQGMNKQQQAEKLAKMCNERGITKQDLTNIINTLNGKK